jgi:hypothetical protein
MATTYKILGQGVPTTSTSTTLYTVPNTSTQTVVSTVTICNTSSSAAGAYLYLVKGGGSAGTTNALVYNTSILGNSTVTLTLGLTLSNTGGTADFIVGGTGTSGALTFTVSGSEIA